MLPCFTCAATNVEKFPSCSACSIVALKAASSHVFSRFSIIHSLFLLIFVPKPYPPILIVPVVSANVVAQTTILVMPSNPMLLATINLVLIFFRLYNIKDHHNDDPSIKIDLKQNLNTKIRLPDTQNP